MSPELPPPAQQHACDLHADQKQRKPFVSQSALRQKDLFLRYFTSPVIYDKTQACSQLQGSCQAIEVLTRPLKGSRFQRYCLCTFQIKQQEWDHGSRLTGSVLPFLTEEPSREVRLLALTKKTRIVFKH